MDQTREYHLAEGEVFFIRKPKGWTSFDVVARMRSILHFEKIGHSGSLDPLATGLMIVCTGKMTKELDGFVGLEKEYVATIRLGGRTASYDSETEVTAHHTVDDVTEEKVVSVLAEFVGPQVQIPPMWSAVKVGGKPLYKYARRGKLVERKPREVFVKSMTLLGMDVPDVTLNIVCSKGTYVRTLAEDIGQRLGCGAYLIALDRRRIGSFRVEDACSLEDLVVPQQSSRIP